MRLVARAVLILAGGLSGCATLERGASDQIHVITDPPGAKASTSTGATCLTPCDLEVTRKDDVTVAVAKDGYDTQQVDVMTRSVATAAATSREITADYLGRVIDYRNGATLIHVPNPVTFKLVKTAVVPPG